MLLSSHSRVGLAALVAVLPSALLLLVGSSCSSGSSTSSGGGDDRDSSTRRPDDTSPDLPSDKDAGSEPRDASHDRDADAGHDVDTRPPTVGFDCVKEWPAYDPPKTPAPSIPDKPTLALLGVEAVSASGLQNPPSLWGGRLALTGGNIVWSLNLADGTWSKFYGASSTCLLVSPPAPRPDTPGAFAVGCIGILGLNPDFTSHQLGSNGRAWGSMLGPNIGPSETTYISPMLAHPEGTLSFWASDGTMRTIRSANGASVWTQQLPRPIDWGYGANLPYFGVGDRFVVGGHAYDRHTGVAFDSARLNGEDQHLLYAAYGKRLLASPFGFGSRKIHILDECGVHQWTTPELQHFRMFIGFDDALHLTTPVDANTPAGAKYASYIYSRDGQKLAGPGEGFDLPLALGADGVAYYGKCVAPTNPSHLDELEVVAVAPSLEVKARLNVGGACPFSNAFLMDDGQLWIVHKPSGASTTQISRLQTASPGLAKTAWPTHFHDNARTGWVSPW